jgi:hypothetical protein
MLFLILRQVMIFFFIEKMKTMLESMVKKNAKNRSLMTEKGLKVKKP